MQAHTHFLFAPKMEKSPFLSVRCVTASKRTEFSSWKKSAAILAKGWCGEIKTPLNTYHSSPFWLLEPGNFSTGLRSWSLKLSLRETFTWNQPGGPTSETSNPHNNTESSWPSWICQRSGSWGRQPPRSRWRHEASSPIDIWSLCSHNAPGSRSKWTSRAPWYWGASEPGDPAALLSVPPPHLTTWAFLAMSTQLLHLEQFDRNQRRQEFCWRARPGALLTVPSKKPRCLVGQHFHREPRLPLKTSLHHRSSILLTRFLHPRIWRPFEKLHQGLSRLESMASSWGHP